MLTLLPPTESVKLSHVRVAKNVLSQFGTAGQVKVHVKSETVTE